MLKNVFIIILKIICYKFKSNDNCYAEPIFKYRPSFCFFLFVCLNKFMNIRLKQNIIHT